MSYTKLNFKAEFKGLSDYQDISAQQLGQADVIRGTKDIHVMGLEFHPVITLGVRGSRDHDIAQPDIDRKIPVVQTDRGGQATMHVPGQLVIYPMMDLKTYGIGVRDFVCVMTKATSSALKKYGIESFSGEAPGLYTTRGKIAFLGIRLDRGVVRHGLAINVSNDVSVFNAIRSCGVSAAALDRVQSYGSVASLSIETLFRDWIVEFQRELDLVQRANNEICSLQSAKDPLTIVANH